MTDHNLNEATERTIVAMAVALESLDGVLGRHYAEIAGDDERLLALTRQCGRLVRVSRRLRDALSLDDNELNGMLAELRHTEKAILAFVLEQAKAGYHSAIPAQDVCLNHRTGQTRDIDTRAGSS